MGYGWHRTTGARAAPDPRGPTCPDRPPCETRSESSPARASGSRSSTRARRSATTRPRRSRPPRARWTRLRDLQDRMWAEAKHSVLVVLQGIDAAGKDGTIAKVMEAFNPQGCPVTSFKVPSAEELAHDFLWRVHKRTPGKGEVGIFNRSHYEDVLVVRVHDLVPKRVWSKRYDQINDFERMLADSGTTIVKFFLHDRSRRAAQAVPGALRRPDEALEVQPGRPRGAQALGRLPGRVRRGALEDVDRLGAVVRHPGQPELVPQPRRVDDPRRHDGRPEAGLPGPAGPAPEPRHRVGPAAAALPAAAQGRSSPAAKPVSASAVRPA